MKSTKAIGKVPVFAAQPTVNFYIWLSVLVKNISLFSLLVQRPWQLRTDVASHTLWNKCQAAGCHHRLTHLQMTSPSSISAQKSINTQEQVSPNQNPLLESIRLISLRVEMTGARLTSTRLPCLGGREDPSFLNFPRTLNAAGTKAWEEKLLPWLLYFPLFQGKFVFSLTVKSSCCQVSPPIFCSGPVTRHIRSAQHM
jgi:hypothetical protein